MESVLTQKFLNGRYTRINHPMVGHITILLSYVYNQRVKIIIVNSSFSHEITNLSTEVTMNIQKDELLLNLNGWPNETSKGDIYYTNIKYRKALEIIIQVDFLLTYVAMRVFYALSVVCFKVIVRREWGRITVDCSLIPNMIYQFIFKDNKLFCMDHKCIRQKFPLVYNCDVLVQHFHQYNL